MTMLMRAVLNRAKRAMAAKSRVGTSNGPSWTTSSSGASDPARRPVGTTIEAVKATSR